MDCAPSSAFSKGQDSNKEHAHSYPLVTLFPILRFAEQSYSHEDSAASPATGAVRVAYLLDIWSRDYAGKNKGHETPQQDARDKQTFLPP